MLRDAIEQSALLPVDPETLPEFHPRYNIAPGAEIAVLARNRAGRIAAVPMIWGLVPHWSGGPSSRISMFNARSETIERKPAFRDAFRARRALVPASGYYEWQAGAAGKKQPWLIMPSAGGLFYFAALWDQWRAPDGALLLSAAIVTKAAIDSLAALHHRMPVILDAGAAARWLEAEASKSDLRDLMAGGAALPLTARPVGSRVGDARQDGPELIEII